VDPTGEAFFVVPMIVGAGIGAATDVGLQLLLNGGRINCIDWGQVAASAGLGALGGGLGSLTRLKRVGTEFSHWIPDRYLRPLSLSGKSANPYYKPWLDNAIFKKFLNSSLNGNYVIPKTHSLTDPMRNLAGQRSYEKLPLLIRQFVRIPAFITGSTLGGAVAEVGSSLSDSNEECECGL
jgi:hypothetical protein